MGVRWPPDAPAKTKHKGIVAGTVEFIQQEQGREQANIMLDEVGIRVGWVGKLMSVSIRVFCS